MLIKTLRFHKRIWVPFFVFCSLFALLFQYRILALLKKFGSDVTPIGTKFSITLDFQNAPQWLLPFYHTVDYINTVWFTTIIGLFIAGGIAAFLPKMVQNYLKGNKLAQHFAGVILGIPNMFCSCCAVSSFTGLRKTGAGLGPSIAFFVTAPALNIVVILLAFNLLPMKLAIARLILGLAAAIIPAYAITKLFPKEVIQGEGSSLPEIQDNEITIEGMIKNWLSYTWNITKTVIPMLLAGFFIMGLLKTFFPFESIAKHFGNGFLSTILASIIGTVLTVPTFTEVLWVKEFLAKGMGTGPLAALLITLPAVSFPSLWVLGRVLKSYKVALFLAIIIAVIGIIGGFVFSMI